MPTALDADPQWLDEHEKNFVANIRKFGWFATHVFADDGLPGFSYTTGIWTSLKFPELITFSLKRENAHGIFWEVFNAVKAGTEIAVGKPIPEMLVNGDITLLPVDTSQFEAYLGWSRWFYGGDNFRCLQLVWPDRSGRFPWQIDFDIEFADQQPDLTSGAWGRSGLS